MRTRGPLKQPRHARDVATEACTKCGSKIGQPCEQLVAAWPPRADRPYKRTGQLAKRPHMTR